MENYLEKSVWIRLSICTELYDNSQPSTRRLLNVEKSPLASRKELEIKDLRNEKFILKVPTAEKAGFEN